MTRSANLGENILVMTLFEVNPILNMQSDFGLFQLKKEKGNAFHNVQTNIFHPQSVQDVSVHHT